MSGSIHWRVDHQGTHDLQVEIGPDTTVGEVAAALAADVSPAGHPPRPVGGNVRLDTPTPLTLATAGQVIHPGRAAHEAAPRSGSTVRLHRFAGDARTDLDGVEAPVVLRSGPATRRLRFGRNAVHPGVVVEVTHDVRVGARGADPVVLDGVTVHGDAVVPHGGLLRLGEWTASIEVHGDLRPPPPSGPWRTHAPRRGPWPPPAARQVELPAPPDPGRLPGLPWLSMAVPLAMAVAIWAASGSLLWSGFMAVSVGYVVAAAIESRHEARAERRFRTAQFRRELAWMEEELDRLAAEEHERDQLRHPEVDELLGWFDPVSPRVWERDAGHPAPLTVRLGTAELPADTEVTAPGGPVTPAELQQLAARHQRHRRAAVVDLAAGGGLAIIGESTQTERLLDAVLFQLAVLVPPELVRLRQRPAATGPGRWTDWLPHRRPGPAATVRVIEDHDAGSHAAAEGELLIWRAPTTAGLPGSIGAVVHLHPQGAAELCFGHAPPLEVDLELLDPASAEPAARQLSGLALGEVGLPLPATLGGIGLPLSDDQVRRRWAPGGSWSDRRALSAPVGIAPGGGVVHLDLVADGPHCLVGGTTGSGKSELLVTWVAGLAALHPPSRLAVLLVDYKGGTSFGPLHRLPHCAGLVTDLTPQLAERALTGMRAELRRRERQVGSAGAGDVAALAPDDAPPSLVVVIDEFATLLDELPEFVDGVLDIARRGRSLGIHLIMATQRPAGVISDAIRANTSLRIALRLPDEDDSRDVLGTPAAARLPRDLPGRALVRFDHDRLLEVQVAHAGAAATATSLTRVRPLRDHDPRPPGDGHRGPAEIDLLVDACAQVASRLGFPAAEAPWCDPLPSVLDLPTGPPPDAPSGTVVLGSTDVPEEQRHGLLAVELLRSGGVLAVGAPGSGTSTTLISLAATASAAGWRVEAIDGGGGLRCLGAVPADDHELVHRLLRSLHEHGGGPPTLLLVDDLAAFELAQRGVNRGEAMELLAHLATCAPNRRLALGVSARRRGDVPHELLHALGDRLVHRCHDLEAAMAWDAPAWLADPELPPGRIAHRGGAAQVARCSGELPRLVPPPRLPVRFALGDVPDGDVGGDPVDAGDAAEPLRLAIGLDATSLAPAVVDLRGHHLLVAGGPRSGKSTTLATLAASAARRGLPTAAPVGPGELRRLLVDIRTGAVGPPAVVLVDDVETWSADREAEAALHEVLGLAAEHSVRLVVAGDATALWRSHSEVIDRVRAGRCGLVLGDDAHDHDALLNTQLPRRDDLRLSAGRGWLVRRGAASLVQVAVAMSTA
jgi:S-DNA-T family DNA segregation ATPase FtsK/SpoIIIE